MRQDKTYGTSVEMLALSEIYKINFNIFTQVEQQTNGRVSTYEKPTRITKEAYEHNINLLLTGHTERLNY